LATPDRCLALVCARSPGWSAQVTGCRVDGAQPAKPATWSIGLKSATRTDGLTPFPETRSILKHRAPTPSGWKPREPGGGPLLRAVRPEAQLGNPADESPAYNGSTRALYSRTAGRAEAFDDFAAAPADYPHCSGVARCSSPSDSTGFSEVLRIPTTQAALTPLVDTADVVPGIRLSPSPDMRNQLLKTLLLRNSTATRWRYRPRLPSGRRSVHCAWIVPSNSPDAHASADSLRSARCADHRGHDRTVLRIANTSVLLRKRFH
jgi:hypothetical protein